MDRYGLVPNWPAPANVMACVPYRNCYRMVAKECHWQTEPRFLKEVHGIQVVKAQPDSTEEKEEGDAIWTDIPELPCAVVTADCLSVIFCDLNGTKVAAAHAGWKGLLKGVLKETVETLGVPPEQLMAWFGPAISQDHFEVGPEVRDAFSSVVPGAEAAFVPGKGDRWYGDLYAIARMRLEKVGVKQVFGGGLCTYRDKDHWFSRRRDGPLAPCQATIIWLKSGMNKS